MTGERQQERRCGELYGEGSLTILLDGPQTCQELRGHAGDHRYENDSFGMTWNRTRLLTWTKEPA